MGSNFGPQFREAHLSTDSASLFGARVSGAHFLHPPSSPHSSPTVVRHWALCWPHRVVSFVVGPSALVKKRAGTCLFQGCASRVWLRAVVAQVCSDRHSKPFTQTHSESLDGGLGAECVRKKSCWNLFVPRLHISAPECPKAGPLPDPRPNSQPHIWPHIWAHFLAPYLGTSVILLYRIAGIWGQKVAPHVGPLLVQVGNGAALLFRLPRSVSG